MRRPAAPRKGAVAAERPEEGTLLQFLTRHCVAGRRGALIGLAALAAAFAAESGDAWATEGPDPWRLCPSLIEAAEQAMELPAHLLQSISKVESGRWNEAEGARLAWPWTVSAKGKGRYLPSKQAMLKEIRALQRRGIKSIDVGCMQVNLKYHGDAFDSLEQAVDPVHNVAYAAVFLSQLRAGSRSWPKAVGHYHSQTPKLGSKYRRKVMDAWRQEKRLAVKKALEQRRAQVAAVPQQAPAERPEIPPPPPPVKVSATAEPASRSAFGGIDYRNFFGLFD